ncbi:hypothetical protein Trydic_g20657, partial [Trypoxylus dichotomus]
MDVEIKTPPNSFENARKDKEAAEVNRLRK